jgi:PKHD-type hydroxylase
MLPTCWKWDKEISDDLISIFMKDVEKRELSKGLIPGGVIESVRKSQVILFPPVHYFSGILANYAMIANSAAKWNRHILGADCVQYAQYGEGEFYDWHIDTVLLTEAPIHRKLTIVCLLNDPSEFEGGALELDSAIEQPALAKGSVIVFPSHVRHRVTPVTKGIRKTATCWVMGPSNW